MSEKNFRVSVEKNKIFKKEKEESKSSNQSSGNQNSEYLKKKSLDYVIKDGIFTSIKSGFTESFIIPFAIALNASVGIIAALASLPQLLANFFQLFSERALVFFKTRSKLIFWTALIQSFMWLPLLAIPFIAKDYFFLLLLFVTLEAILGAFQGPIYISILGDLVPENKRGEFFGNRNRIVSLIHFISTIFAGLIINFFKKLDTNGAFYVFFGFGILFIVAFISRLIAAFYKKKIYEEKYVYEKKNVSFIKFLKNMRKDNYGVFVLFVFLLRLSASISTPFFALYLLKDLSLGYLYFTIIIGVSIVANFFAMSFWGKMIDKEGSKKVLTISAFLVPFSPLLLILAVFIDRSWVFVFLLVEEIFAGVAWAAFNLSASSFLFDATTPKERIRYISYYNFLVGFGIFVGATVGSLLIKIYPVWVTSSLTLVLLTSGILRLLVTVLLIRKVREARMIEIDFPGRGFFHNTVSIIPRHGINVEIVGVYHHEHQDFHNILPPKRKPINPVKEEERRFYERKSIELYRENAMKTLTQKQKEYETEDDSFKIEKELEKNVDKIENITNDIKNKNTHNIYNKDKNNKNK